MNRNKENIRKLRKANFANIPDTIGKEQASFKIDVRRFITDVDGTIQPKTFLPLYARDNYPVWLFGNYDKDGGYYIGRKTFPVKDGLFYLYTATVGVDMDLLKFSGANNIQNEIKTGDQIYLFSDSPQYPNFFVWIVVSSGRRSYASMLSNPLSVGMDVFMMRYFVDNEVQYNESLSVVLNNEVGNYETNPIPPLRYKTTDYEQDGLIEINSPIKVTNYTGIYFYLNFDCDALSFVMRYFKPTTGINVSFDKRIINNLRTVNN